MASVQRLPHDAINVQSVGDLFDQAELMGFEASASPSDRAVQFLRGRSGIVQLRPGLELHYSDSVAVHDISVEADCPPNISVKIFLSGHVNASIGGLRMPMPQSSDDISWQPIAVLLSQPKSERFVRSSVIGSRLRKVSVSFTRDWLNDSALIEEKDRTILDEFMNCHLSMRTWVPSKAAASTVEQILNPPDMPQVVRSLYLESRSLMLIAEALHVLLGGAGTQQRGVLSPLHRKSLTAIDTLLASHGGGALNVEDLAEYAGTSPNTLRRLMQVAHGQSLTEYVRRRRLERARSFLEAGAGTIADAAYLAGYESAANFATAFRRQFGLSPRSVKVHR